MLSLQKWCCGSLKVLDEEEVQNLRDFPDTVKIWKGGAFKDIGSGIKYRKIAFFKIQLYAVALYIEEDAAKAELQRLEKKGFFKDYSEDELCNALQVASFKKLLQIHLLRNVSFSQFTGEIGRDLKPRLDSSGGDDLWLKFESYFRDKSLRSGSNLLALTLEDRTCEGSLFAPDVTDFTQAEPGLKFDSDEFSKALLDVYIGTGKCVPDARTKWADAAKSLLAKRSQAAKLRKSWSQLAV